MQAVSEFTRTLLFCIYFRCICFIIGDNSAKIPVLLLIQRVFRDILAKYELRLQSFYEFCGVASQLAQGGFLHRIVTAVL